MSDNSVTVLRSSAHAHPQWRNCGGGRRSEQIEEILSRHSIGWIDEFSNAPASRVHLFQAAIRLRFTRPVVRLGRKRNVIRYLAGDYLRHLDYFKKNPTTVFLVEECIDFARLRAAHDAQVGIICCPHNFETLQLDPPRDFYSGEGMPGCLHREVMFTNLGNAVFCISREEQWLLTQYGSTADFLPYFPPTAELAKLSAIRALRTGGRPGNGILVVASGANARNLEGLVELAKLVAELPHDDDYHLHIGGFQTESLRSRFPADRCTFYGEIPQATLAELMVGCKAAIIHQTSGAGALTRIPELLSAGIPVLASPHAARSGHHLSGLYIYNDATELHSLARSRLPLPPMPSPDRAAEERLAAAIRRLAVCRQ